MLRANKQFISAHPTAPPKKVTNFSFFYTFEQNENLLFVLKCITIVEVEWSGKWKKFHMSVLNES